MGEWLGVLAALGSAGAWHAAASSPTPGRWRALAAVAFLAAASAVDATATDVAAWWLVPIAAWLAGATAAILVRPFAPRAVDATAAGCALLGVLGAIALVGGGVGA